MQHVHLILRFNNLSSPLAHLSACLFKTNENLFWLEVGEIPPSAALKRTSNCLLLSGHFVVLFLEWKI